MTKQAAAILLGTLYASAALSAGPHVYFVGDFESGQIRSTTASHDGFYLATLPNPQVGGEFLHSGQSTFDSESRADTRVVKSDVVGGETVLPRSGEFFLRSEVFFDKDYLDLNDRAKNRPRSKIYFASPEHLIDFDQEGFVGFSIRIPNNFEDELGVRDHRGESMLFVMNADSSRTLLNLGVWVESPNREAHWYLRTWNSDDTVDEKGDNVQVDVHDLGPVSADKGKWTDFVLRYRFNPFTTTTNPRSRGIPDSQDRTFEGNKGILQVWKAEGSVGPNGDRSMALKINRVNLPLGLVPNSIEKIAHRWRIYKYGWHSNPTTLTHPIWFGFDEIRQGLVARDGTSFEDVAPSGEDCETDCGAQTSGKPRPPSQIAVD